MKVTKSFLKQLVLEEVRGFGQGKPGKDNFSKKRVVYMEEGDGDEEDLAKSLNALALKFKKLVPKIPKVEGFDPQEIALFDRLISDALKAINQGNAAVPLQRARGKLRGKAKGPEGQEGLK